MVIIRFSKHKIYCMLITITSLMLWCYPDLYRPVVKVWHKMLFTPNLRERNIKYLLVWSDPKREPFKNLGVGRSTFLNRRCAVNNCYVTSDRYFFEDVADFEVVLFHGPELSGKLSTLPRSRATNQKYVYASMESSGYYPICDQIYNGFFNWTWTYKLKSDQYYGYLIIRDKEGNVIGPKKDIQWEKVEAMEPINNTLKKKLKTKKIAAAWFVSNCDAPSGRLLKAKELFFELTYYHLRLDIYGSCGTKQCPRSNMTECLRILERDYYFYLSFENSFSEDYVTEKLLHALQHYTVPIVYGGADYSRFMPDGIYLDAQKYTMSALAKLMASIINDKEMYYSFFKWHNHYSYHDLAEAPDTDAYCRLCAMVNNETYFNRTSVYNDFTQWWSPPHRCH